ncbi:MAG: transposase domain-containing protein [Candidatus Parvibacillus calidus]|nr:MAG: transposase domain-containing protein [Candidatus Parvibacillus calidus]
MSHYDIYFCGTCKAKGINPYEWLADTLNKIALHPINQIHELVPGYIPKNEG